MRAVTQKHLCFFVSSQSPRATQRRTSAIRVKIYIRSAFREVFHKLFSVTQRERLA